VSPGELSHEIVNPPLLLVAKSDGRSLNLFVAVSKNDCELCASPSLTVKVTVVVPTLCGRTDSVRLRPLVPIKMFPFGSTLVLDDVPVTTRLVLSTSPISTGANADTVLTGTLAFGSGAMIGASFVSVTVNSNARLPASAPSLTHTVIVAMPN
jgi:hypothetical protein